VSRSSRKMHSLCSGDNVRCLVTHNFFYPESKVYLCLFFKGLGVVHSSFALSLLSFGCTGFPTDGRSELTPWRHDSELLRPHGRFHHFVERGWLSFSCSCWSGNREHFRDEDCLFCPFPFPFPITLTEGITHAMRVPSCSFIHC